MLDEATSALDPATEGLITQFLARLSSELTIVLVSHRQSALKYCDLINRLEQGRLVQDELGHAQLHDGERTSTVWLDSN